MWWWWYHRLQMVAKKNSGQIDLGQVGTVIEGLLYVYSAEVAGLEVNVVEPGQKTPNGKLVPEGRAGIVIERGSEAQMQTFWQTHEAFSGRRMFDERESFAPVNLLSSQILNQESRPLRANLLEKLGRERK